MENRTGHRDEPIDARIARAIALRYRSRFLQGYVRSKIASDPIYRAVLPRLRGIAGPVLDIGCGIGLLGQLVREAGLAIDVVGIDFDERKIDAARQATAGIGGLRFELGDARKPVDFAGSAVLLDLLHYFGDDDQRAILECAASYARPGDVVIVRDCIDDGSWRYRATWLEETIATSLGWLRGERLNFPTKESISAVFRERGYDEEVVPLWGRTPFNNHLLSYWKR
ncbi:MAG: class I SAM-dependent methyltransferase [Acidobacteria bacterium]|nr:class I SAM-dependent methyltransferase [Acidobacteriota bacterium]